MEMRWMSSAPSCHRGWFLSPRRVPLYVGFTTRSKQQPSTPCGWTEPRPWPPHLYTTATFMSRHLLAATKGETNPKGKRRRVRKGQGGVGQVKKTETTSAKANSQDATDCRKKSHLSLMCRLLAVGHPLRAPAGHPEKSGMSMVKVNASLVTFLWRCKTARVFQR